MRVRACSHGCNKARQTAIYLYVSFIGIETGAYNEHMSIYPLVAPCRFPCEQDLSMASINSRVLIVRIYARVRSSMQRWKRASLTDFAQKHLLRVKSTEYYV